MDKEDLCVAKICAFRPKDQQFVSDLVAAGLVDRDVIIERLPTVPERYAAAADNATRWLLTLPGTST